jgi:hypothetical protein
MNFVEASRGNRPYFVRQYNTDTVITMWGLTGIAL